MRLNTAALKKLTSVAVPAFITNGDRAQIAPGVVHVGVGNFHRAHMGAYFDDLLESDFEATKDWGIVGASIRGGPKKRDDLIEQDFLNLLVEQDGTDMTASVLGSLIDFVPASVDPVTDAMTAPETKIVSLTVTEGGYYLNDGKFDLENPDIQNDIANPETPKTIFGVITRALKARKEAGSNPFTVLCCDNLPHNGDVVQSVVCGLAAAQDPELKNWIEENVAFPNSMVDRIAPTTTDEKIQAVTKKFGVEDSAPVFCEPFRQWIIEDNFCAGRPPLEKCDTIEFVEDVTPYEYAKIRILNGGHASLCYPSALMGLECVHNAMEHPTIMAFLNKLEKTEIIPTVPSVPGTYLENLEEYWQVIAKRFGNSALADTIPRICFGGAANQPKFIIPVMVDTLKAGRDLSGLALVSAAWCRYCQGTTEDGTPIAANDPQWDRLNALALKAKDDPKLWLGMEDVYGDLGKDPVFEKAFVTAFNKIQDDGVEAALKEYIAKVPAKETSAVN